MGIYCLLMKAPRTLSALIAISALLLLSCTPAKAVPSSYSSTCLERIPLYLVRHGESEDNLNNIATGWSATPLTDKGRAQARRTGRYLSAVDFSKFYSSDLTRAIQTGNIINDRLLNPLEIVQSENFREWNLGKFTGLQNTVAQKAMMRQLGYNMKFTTTSWNKFVWQTSQKERMNALAAADETGETETYRELRLRLLAGVDSVVSNCSAGRVIITMHGTAMMVLLKALSKETYYSAGIGNASISVVVLNQGKFVIKKIGVYEPHIW
jgi:probable phosphoglycerate mutase